jgi:transketolase
MPDISFTKFELGPRRGVFVDLKNELDNVDVSETTVRHLEDYDLIYRTLCGILFNFVPKSGHPGGSISSGRIVEALLFSTMAYDFSDPDEMSADILSYAAGHKAMGLYGMWALRNECVRIARPNMLPAVNQQLRLEDLLGFRRNPTQETPLFNKYEAKALDGHPSPLVPFVKLSTGASGVGDPSSFGLALGAADTFGADTPWVHVLEGEGGMTAGRVSEALATVATAQLWNTRLHLDWNQSSIDSDRVCRDGNKPGDYVQWDPAEFCYLHDWNVISVPDGHDMRQVLAAQELGKERFNDQPTAIIYRTVKGWKYGIEGCKSHGAGHGYCSDEYFATLAPAEERFGVEFPRPSTDAADGEKREAAFFDSLLTLRKVLEDNTELSTFCAEQVAGAQSRLADLGRAKRDGVPDVNKFYDGDFSPSNIPAGLTYEIGSAHPLRAALGETLGYLNEATGGAFMAASADLMGSTSISKVGAGFADGLYNFSSNPGARLMTAGGICEDNIGAFMSGLSAFGTHIGAGASYGAFIAALQHISARLHGIGQQALRTRNGDPFSPFFIVCAHAGLKTGEDGPTHADPQPLQLLQENFPPGIMITLTPWDPQELYPTVVAALKHRPAVIAPFVTRPNETIVDREALGLPPATAAAEGVYAFRRANPEDSSYHGTLVIQGSGVANTFVSEVLPRIDEAGLNMNIFYVASVELFDLLPAERREEIYPADLADEAMGITGFTLPTMYRWITSRAGREMTVYPFKGGEFLGSGVAHKVLEEAELHGDGQWASVQEYAAQVPQRAKVPVTS